MHKIVPRKEIHLTLESVSHQVASILKTTPIKLSIVCDSFNVGSRNNTDLILQNDTVLTIFLNLRRKKLIQNLQKNFKLFFYLQKLRFDLQVSKLRLSILVSFEISNQQHVLNDCEKDEEFLFCTFYDFINGCANFIDCIDFQQRIE